ncbi:MAG: ribosome biogenesis GTP-binding protein YihA/YsxC [Steroidobacteraceae bacterium]|jgi:GTP-binding protein|nr:YihA family ribosome biogenesis GTP-binding protein [Gammaproteobacteria bacterium]
MSVFPQVEFLLSVAAVSQFPPDTGSEIAVAGRSNAGKSSAINAILERRGLARTSKTPGRTRLLNYFDVGAERRLVDLPGYGYAAVRPQERQTWLPLVAALRERQSLTGLVLIVDSRRGVRDEDEELLAWADPSRRSVHVLLSKVDKLNQADRAAALKSATKRLDGRATVQIFSAHSRLGLAQAQATLQELWQKKPPGPV